MTLRVLISGAGIAGPSLAFFLAKSGARITIVEKAQSLLPHGQNVDIVGSALTVVEKMGLMSEIRQNNTREKGTQFIDPRGKPFAPFPIKEGLQVSPTSEFEILRGDLAKVFHDATKGHPNINYRLGTTINEVISNDDKSVKVKLDNGEVHEFDLLVAADGQWSKVRKQCFTPESVQVIDTGMYVVYFTVPRLPVDNDWWNVFVALESRIITTRPDPYGTIRVMFTHMPCGDAKRRLWADVARTDRKTQGELLKRTFWDAGWQARRFLESMDQAPDFYFHVIEQIKMSKWSSSRVICLGDTAFAPSPLTGMGTSLAINGAYILAGELSKLGEGEHPAKALEAYENLYRPFVEKMQQIAPLVPGIVHPEGPAKRWLLQTFVSLVSKVVAVPWIASKIGSDRQHEIFSLPEYPAFQKDSLK